jgi:hypothetical protein
VEALVFTVADLGDTDDGDGALGAEAVVVMLYP